MSLWHKTPSIEQINRDHDKMAALRKGRRRAEQDWLQTPGTTALTYCLAVGAWF